MESLEMSELFSTTKQNIYLHIGNIFREGELIKEVVVKDFFTTTIHGAIPGKTLFYNLDAILSVGYGTADRFEIDYAAIAYRKSDWRMGV